MSGLIVTLRLKYRHPEKALMSRSEPKRAECRSSAKRAMVPRAWDVSQNRRCSNWYFREVTVNYVAHIHEELKVMLISATLTAIFIDLITFGVTIDWSRRHQFQTW